LEAGVGVEEVEEAGLGVGFGEDGVEVGFEGGGELHGLDPFAAGKGLGPEGVPQTGGVEELDDGFGGLSLELGDEVGGQADLKAVESRGGADGVEGVGDEVLGSAGGTGGTADFHGDTVEHEGGAEEAFTHGIAMGAGDELEDGGVGEEGGEVVHRRTSGVSGGFPVVNGGEFGHQIADPGPPQLDGSLEGDSGVDEHAEGHGSGEGASATGEGEAGLGTAEAVVGEGGGDGEVGETGEEGDVFGGIEGFATAEAEDGLAPGIEVGEDLLGLFEAGFTNGVTLEDGDGGVGEGGVEALEEGLGEVLAVEDDDTFEMMADGVATEVVEDARLDADEGGDGDLSGMTHAERNGGLRVVEREMRWGRSKFQRW
jgi:hypothetical protein